jgi:hypothetical protein
MKLKAALLATATGFASLLALTGPAQADPGKAYARSIPASMIVTAPITTGTATTVIIMIATGITATGNSIIPPISAVTTPASA